MDVRYKVDESGCHTCTSHCKDKDGYPKFYRGGKHWRIHRWIYYQKTGERPEVVMHTCDNPSCINPNHLVGGSSSDNVRDKVNKGRQCIGERNGSSVLKKSNVSEIRKRIQDGECQADLAREFGVTRSAVQSIKTNKTWKQLIIRKGG